jgi:hypothetical protein
MRLETGQIVSGAGHAALILWVLVGGFFQRPSDTPAVAVTSVSLMTSAEFDAMASAAPKPPVEEPALEAPAEVQTDPVSSPRPAAKPVREAAPAPEPQPETETNPDVSEIAALPEPEVIEAPEPIAPVAPVEQPVLVPNTEEAKPLDAPRVAPVPAEAPEPDAEIAETPTPAVSPDAVGEVVEEEVRPEAAPEAATTQIITEAVETDDAPELAPTASLRPRQKPVAAARTEAPVEEQVASAETETPAEETPSEESIAEATEEVNVDDAVAAALAEAATETSGNTGTDAPAGPPMTDGEKDALRVAVQQCWNVGSLSSDALRVTVTVGVSMGQTGVPDAGSIRMIAFEGGSEGAARQAYEAARRAIIICGKNGFPLPADKYDQWRDIEMVFNPERMRIR